MSGVAVVAISVLLFLACNRSGSAGSPVRAPASGPLALLSAKPRDLPQVVRDRYRLPPDRRFLMATADVALLLSGRESGAATASFRAGRWQVLAEGRELGVVSEYPSFDEATDLLVRHARSVLAGGASASALPASAAQVGALKRLRGSLDRPRPEEILANIAALDLPAALTAADGDLVRTMVSSLAWVAALTTDSLDLSDALLARAWAWLALERALEIPGDEGSDSLLAWALGYEAEAGRLSAELSPDDAIRMFVTGRADLLAAFLERRRDDVPAHVLRLALHADREDVRRYRAAAAMATVRDESSLARLGFEVRLRDFATRAGAGRELAERTFGAATACGGAALAEVSDPVGVEARTREFESALAQCAASFRRSPLGVVAADAFYRSFYYSGLFAMADFALNQLSSGPAALGLAAAFIEPAEGPADGLRRWLMVSGAVVDGGRDAGRLAELVESSPPLGGRVLLDLGKSIAGLTDVTDPLRRRPIPALLARLDTRPPHRVIAARLAERNLRSLWLLETFASQAADAAPHRSGELPALVAEMRRDASRLREIAEDPAMPAYTQAVALGALAESGNADDVLVRLRYEAIARDPDEGVSLLVGFLEDRNDLTGALTAVMDGLAREGESGSLRWAYLRSEAARLKLRLGDAEGAWKMVEPALATGKENAYLEGAEVQLARRRYDSALQLARTGLERYPRSFEAAGLLAQARWHLNDDKTAAAELAVSRTGIAGPWNRYLPEAFVATFAGAPPERSRRAFESLVAAGIAPNVLADVAIAFGKKVELETALSFLESLPRPSPVWAPKILIDAHDLIRERQGAEAAAAWYRLRHTPTHEDALTLFQLGKYEQVLSLFAIADRAATAKIVRLLQAAALLHLNERDGPRRQELSEVVASEGSSDDYFVRTARFLLGQVDEEAVLPLITNLETIASVGWAMGVKAASERRFEVADGWFQVALESGQKQQPPHAWSWQIESDWIEAQRSTMLLEMEGKF
jgi:hypothetical protein